MCFNEGKCLTQPEALGWCDCSGTGYSGETCRTASAGGVPAAWLYACVVVTALGSLSLLCLIPWHRRTLLKLRPLKLPDNDRNQSYGATALFFVGIIDVVLSVKTCYELFPCKELEDSIVLALCFLAALVVNYSATTCLILDTLSTIREQRRDDCPATLQRLSVDSATTTSSTTRAALLHPTLIRFLILGSIPRFQTLAMLRLRLYNKEVFDHPMDDRHMFFLRNAGLHHIFVADIPVAVISMALIQSTVDDVRSPCEGDRLDWAKWMLGCKIALTIWNGVG